MSPKIRPKIVAKDFKRVPKRQNISSNWAHLIEIVEEIEIKMKLDRIVKYLTKFYVCRVNSRRQSNIKSREPFLL